MRHSSNDELYPEAIRLRVLGTEIAGSFEWFLLPGIVWRIGRGDEKDKPEVDLAFDWSVSREHARAWFKNGCWWIEDVGGKSGTLLDEELLQPGLPVELPLDSRLRLGATELLVEPSYRHRLRLGDRIVEIDVATGLNLSVVQSAASFISRLAVVNPSERITPADVLLLSLSGYASFDPIRVPVLAPHELHMLECGACRYHTDSLESLTEATTATLELHLGKDMWSHQLHVFPVNQWSLHPLHRKTIASFVMPNHRQVVEAVANARATASVGKGDSISAGKEHVLRTLYEYFQSAWRIVYQHEMPSFGLLSQRIRLPHHVLLVEEHHIGQGTCIDLVLLMASCLESVGAQPLVLLLLNERKREYHALLACWKTNADRRQVFVNDKDVLIEHALIVECIGFSTMKDEGGQPISLTFEQALQTGKEYLQINNLLTAVDVAAARNEGVKPLPFGAQPKESPNVIQILKRAEGAAKHSRDGTCTILHLVWSLLTQPDSLFAKGAALLEVNPSHIIRRLESALFSAASAAVSDRSAVEKSDHYEQVLASAKVFALRSGSYLITEKDLVKGLLDCHSEGFDHLLHSFNIQRAKLKDVVHSLTGHTLSEESSYSILENLPSKPKR
jgi:hypothetical protein